MSYSVQPEVIVTLTARQSLFNKQISSDVPLLAYTVKFCLLRQNSDHCAYWQAWSKALNGKQHFGASPTGFWKLALNQTGAKSHPYEHGWNCYKPLTNEQYASHDLSAKKEGGVYVQTQGRILTWKSMNCGKV